jgi:hypothetical protein
MRNGGGDYSRSMRNQQDQWYNDQYDSRGRSNTAQPRMENRDRKAEEIFDDMYAQLDNITKREQFRNVPEYLNLFDLHA